jgi:hypothetical protein
VKKSEKKASKNSIFVSYIYLLNSGITPIQTQDPELISRLKESLLETLFEKLSHSLSSLEDRLERLQRENRLLRELRRLDLLEKYGPSAEMLSESQLELLELEPGVSRAEVEAETQREQLTLPLKAARKHPGRQQLPAGLPGKNRSLSARPSNAFAASAVKKPP